MVEALVVEELHVEADAPRRLRRVAGGRCTCSGGGGCLLQNPGPWHDSEVAETLKRLSTQEIAQSFVPKGRAIPAGEEQSAFPA